MTETQPMQADGKGTKGEKDGVSHPASGGESDGGAYPNPHTGKKPQGFDGGQSDKTYSGPDNPNATTRA